MRLLALVALLALAAPLAAQAQTQARPDRMLADTNHDNKLSLEEYQTSRRNFLMSADTNKDGVISRAEWAKGAETLRNRVALNGVDGGDLIGRAGLFDVLDTDKSGTITPAEIDAASAARFAKADTNHDGFLTRAEISAFLRESKAK